MDSSHPIEHMLFLALLDASETTNTFARLALDAAYEALLEVPEADGAAGTEGSGTRPDALQAIAGEIEDQSATEVQQDGTAATSAASGDGGSGGEGAAQEAGKPHMLSEADAHAAQMAADRFERTPDNPADAPGLPTANGKQNMTVGDETTATPVQQAPRDEKEGSGGKTNSGKLVQEELLPANSVGSAAARHGGSVYDLLVQACFVS